MKMKCLLFVLLAFVSNTWASEDEEKNQNQDGGILYFSHETGLSFPNKMGFDVPFKGNRERADMTRSREGRLAVGYKRGNLRTEVGVLFESPEVENIYYVKYKGRTMDLYEVNERFSIDGHIDNDSYVGSVWYDFNNSTPWTFYTGGTLGRTHIALDYDIELEGEFKSDSRESGYDSGWANTQELGAGLTYAIGDRALLDVGFRVMRVDRSSFGPEPGGQQGLHLEPFVRKRIVVGLKTFLFGND